MNKTNLFPSSDTYLCGNYLLTNGQSVCTSVAQICAVPVSEWSDDQSVSVPQVFIAKLEPGITDINVTVSGFVIPAMA